MASNARAEPGSFRDRKARVFLSDGEVYRLLGTDALADWRALQATSFFDRRSRSGEIVGTTEVDPADLVGSDPEDSWVAALRHERIPFVSYPYEWCFSMLRDAALLQLDLLLDALGEQMMVKDSSAFNIQWRGATPVFIDIPSFERMEDGAAWQGYGQFCEMFLYPLLLRAYKKVSFRPWLRGSIDGIPADECARLMSLRDLARPGVFKHLYLQSKLQARFADGDQDVRRQLKTAGFSTELIANNVRGLRKLVRRLPAPGEASEWSDYTDTGHYGAEDERGKEEFVRRAAEARSGGLVWDLGCNTGRYSEIASEHADHVVALDADEMSIERLYRRLREGGPTNVLPLVGNLADPSPSLGWRGQERRDLPARGRPDLVLCLALIHHVVISANIPLREFVDWLAGLNADLVIEYVDRTDPMVGKLLRNKDDDYADYGREQLEAALSSWFEIDETLQLMDGRRVLYRARRTRS